LDRRAGLVGDADDLAVGDSAFFSKDFGGPALALFDYRSDFVLGFENDAFLLLAS
jgi:hypothetical protein